MENLTEGGKTIWIITDGSRRKGKIKWYNEKKGYGFITTEDGKQYFVHQTDILRDHFRTAKYRETVEFTPVEEGERPGGKRRAENVIVESAPADFIRMSDAHIPETDAPVKFKIAASVYHEMKRYYDGLASEQTVNKK